MTSSSAGADDNNNGCDNETGSGTTYDSYDGDVDPSFLAPPEAPRLPDATLAALTRLHSLSSSSPGIGAAAAAAAPAPVTVASSLSEIGRPVVDVGTFASDNQEGDSGGDDEDKELESSSGPRRFFRAAGAFDRGKRSATVKREYDQLPLIADDLDAGSKIRRTLDETLLHIHELKAEQALEKERIAPVTDRLSCIATELTEAKWQVANIVRRIPERRWQTEEWICQVKNRSREKPRVSQSELLPALLQVLPTLLPLLPGTTDLPKLAATITESVFHVLPKSSWEETRIRERRPKASSASRSTSDSLRSSSSKKRRMFVRDA